MEIRDVTRMFPRTKWEIRETSSGTEVLLRDCPIDLQGRGASHPSWKVYVNPDKEVLKCFVCHGRGQGMKLSTAGRRARRRSINRVQQEMRSGVREMPDLPLTETLSGCYRKEGSRHPALSYLMTTRRIPLEDAEKAGITWKPEGVAAWTKELAGGVKKEVGTYSGLVIPIHTRGSLVGWQLCAVPRIEGVPKYVTAPGSSLAGSLYNFDRAVSSSTLVVTEGVFDALRIPEMGVALLTDRINKRKRRLISTGGFREVILCLDSDRDNAHINRELASLHGVAPVVRAVALESGDPADYTKQELRSILFEEEIT